MATNEKNIVKLLEHLGEEPGRPGLEDTPERFVKFMEETTKPMEFNFTTFENEGIDEMIVETNVQFYSLCEHHLVPFFGVAHVAYIPGERIAGLSKLARSVEYFARGLQNQERITNQIAELIQNKLNPKGVGVILQARHLCMEMRGVKKPNTLTATSSMWGLMKTDRSARDEFLKLIELNKG